MASRSCVLEWFRPTLAEDVTIEEYETKGRLERCARILAASGRTEARQIRQVSRSPWEELAACFDPVDRQRGS